MRTVLVKTANWVRGKTHTNSIREGDCVSKGTYKRA